MCGIAGFNWPDRLIAQRMAQTMQHRGPDDQGVFCDDHVSLAHRRLAILDLSEKGHQPMHYKGLVIVYNGEIYNFRQLRQLLEKDGYRFDSNTDTEVVVAAYHRWGAACVQRFNGMWAFCIYDPQQRQFFLSRDRFGIKPLYYYFDGHRFIFASELKSILVHQIDKRIDIQAVNLFFYQKYVGRELCILEDVRKLMPGHNLMFDLTSGRLQTERYYDLLSEIDAHRVQSIHDRLEMIEGILTDAIQIRLVADVPVGSFLSGGLDSSLISAIISRNHNNFKTFSIGFRDASYSELRWSRLVSSRLGTDHHYDIMDLDEPVIRAVCDAMDEPFGDASVFPTYLLSGIARRKVIVCLSGDGGDEVFGGYDTYKAYKLASILPEWLIKSVRPLVQAMPDSDKKVTAIFKAKRFVRDLGHDPIRRHMDWMATFNDDGRRQLLTEGFIPAGELLPLPKLRGLLALQFADIQYYLAEDILKKVDMASMLHSLEVRVPFLDYRLVSLVLSLPSQYLLRGLQTKSLLRRMASRYLPWQVVHRPKRGFTAPVSRWIRSSAWIQDCIGSEGYLSHGLLNKGLVHQMLQEHLAHKQDWARQLWLVFIFNNWVHRQFHAGDG